MKSLVQICFILLAGLSLGAQTDPMGWAGLNGGTTGGEGGEVVTVTNRTELLAAVLGDEAKILLIHDTIELNLYERVKVYGNKTLLGATQDAMIRFGGLEIVGNNVILQNLVVGDFYDGDWGGNTHSTDCLTIFGVNVWVDHCWVWAGADGLLDIRGGNGSIADYITISYTRLSNHNKVSLIGAGDDATQDRDHLRVTFDHCWWDGTLERGLNQRMPRVRFGDVHVLNNYYEATNSYAIAARFESDVVVEANYFRDCKNPHEIEDEGLGLEDPDLVAIGNVYELCTGAQETGGEAWVPTDFYAYTPTPVMDVPALVMNEAGPFNPINNIPPIAVTDSIDLGGAPGSMNLLVVDNDLDGDGGDLRLAQIINEPAGIAQVKENKIVFVPPFGASGVDTILYSLVDTQGGVDTGMVLLFYDGLNAISTPNAAGVLKVYPNPVRESATIELPQAVSAGAIFELREVSGKRVSVSGRLLRLSSTQYALRTEQLPAGAYWLHVRDGRRNWSEKIIVQR